MLQPDYRKLSEKINYTQDELDSNGVPRTEQLHLFIDKQDFKHEIEEKIYNWFSCGYRIKHVSSFDDLFMVYVFERPMSLDERKLKWQSMINAERRAIDEEQDRFINNSEPDEFYNPDHQ